MWNRLPREAADIPSVDKFNVGLGGALRNLIQCKVFLAYSRSMNYIIFKGCFQPKPSYNSALQGLLCDRIKITGLFKEKH